MFEAIIKPLAAFVIAAISYFGYMGIVICMAIESACIPLPSEIIMPFAGYLVHTGQFGLIEAGLAGAFGCVVGSVAAYYIGDYGGRPFMEKYGKYVLVTHKELDMADRWFERYGDAAIFISRLLPVIRTFISLPAGIARMNFPKFVIYTFLGSFPWCLGLAWVGMKMGENWNTLGVYFHKFDAVIGVFIVVAVGLFLWRHWPRKSAASA
ncbi:MAG TPA: DedA family protein [Nitrospirota bacterium]|jgi:membrane protein DedA with SNARE-associated domain